MRTDIAALKSRVDLVEIVRPFVGLRRQGPDWWGCCPFHADRTPSFKVSPERQSFYCFGCVAKGDVLDFLEAAEQLDKAAAIRRLRQLADGQAVVPRHRPMPSPPPRSSQDNRERARDIWREAHPLCCCDACAPGRAYLASRAIAVWPEAMFFHLACPFGRRTAPAILAPVNHHPTGYVTAIWRICLTATGDKITRRGLGPARGNCSRLFPADSDEIAITEGVEDALAFHALSGLPTWAALSADFMPHLILPERFRQVTIVQDNDQPGKNGRRSGPEAAQKLARRLLAEGRDVEILAADLGVKDANDVLMSRRAAA